MRMGIKLVALSVVCLLSSCTTAYQPDGLGGGYTDRRLSDNTAQVSFRGNRFSTPETLHAYLLRRCADVTLQNGYNYFVLVNNEPPNERNSDMFGSQVDSATIQMYKDNRPASAYDAVAIAGSFPEESGETGQVPPPASVSTAGHAQAQNPNAPTNQPPSFENMY